MPIVVSAGEVMARDATGPRAEQSVMAGEVTGDTADDGAAQATGVCGAG